ncbi:MAG: DUF1540 domain-containing protein [Bdellovibrio sp.]|nr:DUF1540 domain-containing protein [Bdellovibrio sp.]
MEKLTLEMSLVSQCSVDTCAYNIKNSCHAKAITVGDANNPNCDTFLGSAGHCKEQKRIAGVGACKVSSCKFNEDLECKADKISIGFSGKETYCLTFRV